MHTYDEAALYGGGGGGGDKTTSPHKFSYNVLKVFFLHNFLFLAFF